MSRHLNLFVQGFWRSVATVLTGTAIAQTIPLLGSLILARIYAPAEFGLFSAWVGMASLAAVVLTGRYEVALAVEADGEPRRIGVQAVLWCIAFTTACAVVVSVSLAVWTPGWLQAVPTPLLLALAPTAGLIAASQVWQSWAAAEGRYAVLIRMRISQAVGITGVQIAAGWLHSSAVSLGLAHGIGVLLGTMVAAILMRLGAWTEPRQWCDFLRRHRRFPLLSLPADSVNAAAGQLPLILVASRFGTDVAGLLALTLRTLGAPIAVLGAAILDVFKRQAATAYRERGECRPEFLQTLRMLILVSTGAASVIGLFSDDLFAVAFGERWRAAGTMALWLLPMFAMRFVASPLSYMMYVANKQHVDLFWQLGLLTMTFSALWLPANYVSALQLYSAGYSAMYVVYLALSYRFSLGSHS